MPVNSFENYPMSWKPKLNKTSKPLYIAIAELLEEDINSGILLPGTKLPPQRELADYMDVNISTISRSFKICEKKGLLSGTVGKGTFVAYDANANSYITPKNETAPLIEMGYVFPETSSYEEVTLQVKKMVEESDFEILFQYGSRNNILWRNEAAVKFIKKAGCETTADHLLVANGGQNAIVAILAGLFQPGDRIGTDPVTYPGIKTAAKMLGIQLVPIRHENNEISEEGLLYACKNENIKGIYIMPDFQNPTTHTMSAAGRNALAKIAREQNLIVIEDGIHTLLSDKVEKAVASLIPEQTVYIESLSKVVAPGLRIAYIVTPQKYKTNLSNSLYNINLSVSPFLEELASRMIASKDAEKLIIKHRELTKQRNHLVNQYLSGFSLHGSDECIFRWLILPKGFTGEQFESLAYEAGVQVYAAERFAVGNAKPTPAVRLAVSAPKTMEELETALQILKRLLLAD